MACGWHEPETLIRAEWVADLERLRTLARQLPFQLVLAGKAHPQDGPSRELGADVWLNTPQPPMEASGTSSMKAAFNGVPSVSGRCRFADEKLERTVLPTYYNDRRAWIAIMKGRSANAHRCSAAIA